MEGCWWGADGGERKRQIAFFCLSSLGTGEDKCFRKIGNVKCGTMKTCLGHKSEGLCKEVIGDMIEEVNWC